MGRFLSTLILILITGSAFTEGFYDIETINVFELSFEEQNWDQILDELYAGGDEERLVGNAIINGIAFDSVGVRYKGNSSYNPQNTKNPLNIKLDHIIDGQTFDGFGTLKLANGFKDPSFVRETLSYEIARKYMPAGLANYCQVYINDQYIGLYTSVQSVDKFFKNTHFETNIDVRFKGEISENVNPQNIAVWDYLGTDPDVYADFYELTSDSGWDQLIEFLDIFNNNSELISDYLNVDAHLWMLAYDNLMVNLDAPINYGHNYYLFQDGAELFNPILWDLNENFGVFSNLMGGQHLNPYQLQTLDPLLNIDNPDYPIIGNVLNDQKYQKMYIAHMRTMIEENFQNNWYESRAYELQEIIDDIYQQDPNTFFTYDDFLQNVNATVSTGGGPGGFNIIGITELMEARWEWLLVHDLFQGQIPDISEPLCTPQNIQPGTEVSINATVDEADNVWLYYRFGYNNKFSETEMFDDGLHNDGDPDDGVYGVFISAGYGDLQYYFYAQNDEQGIFLPVRASSEYFEADVITDDGLVIINEINYNSADDFNPEDWVELYNPGHDDLIISGWQFKDENDDHVFTLPDNFELHSGEFLVLCDDLQAFNTLFPDVTNVLGDLGFGFSGSGELLRLFNAEGELIDSVEYSDELPWPEPPDGEGATLELIDPSFDNDLPENWQASLNHGTPGEENSTGMTDTNDQVVSSAYNLSNYPNPFNPETKISFGLKTDSRVVINVYNIKGQKVKNLLDQDMQAGFHDLTWNGRDNNEKQLSSGIYFYRMSTGEYSETRKMMLLK